MLEATSAMREREQDSAEVVGQGAGLPGGGWRGLPLVSRPLLFEGGMAQR